MNPKSVFDWETINWTLAESVVENASGPASRLLGIVRHNDCRTIVVENEYVDLDYLSEFSSFWSDRFGQQSPTTARFHFFSSQFDETSLTNLTREQVGSYLGYFVFRPTILGGVGRSVLKPPRHRSDSLPKIDGIPEPTGLTSSARLTYVVDRPSLFGQPLEIRGVPFCQQDGEFLRCAHASAWLCHYVAFHRRIIGRQKTASIARMSGADGSKHRQLPSMGLTAEQLQGVFTGVGIPAFFVEIKKLSKLPADLPWPKGMSKTEYERRVLEERLARTVCPYLNSGFPVTVFTDSGHAFTLVGWRHADGDLAGVDLIACDDQVGPYEVIESHVLDGKKGPPEEGLEGRGIWTGLMIPLPSTVYLTAEAAENRARQMAEAEAAIAESGELDESETIPRFKEIYDELHALRGGIRVRSRLIEGRRYKAMLRAQGRDPAAKDVISTSRLPLWVWVVEFQDNAARDEEAPCVKAEIVFDSTSHDDAPVPLIVCTCDVVIDVGLVPEDEDDEINAEEPDNTATEPNGSDSKTETETIVDEFPTNSDEDPEVDEDGDVWLADLDGRPWRSLISDSDIDEREYPHLQPMSERATT